MSRYSYEGPVMRFDQCVETHWVAETTASSEAKARNNLAFRWKKEHGLLATTKVSLPGKIIKLPD